MKIIAYVPKDNARHRDVLEAFAEGSKADIRYLGEPEPCDVAVIFGWLKDKTPAKKAMKLAAIDSARGSQNTIVLEEGFIERGKYYSAGIGGITMRSSLADQRVKPGRARACGFSYQPWKCTDKIRKVLVIGQVPWDCTVQHTDHLAWCIGVYGNLVASGFEVRFRPHPLVKPAVYKMDAFMDRANRSLDADLAWADACVTFNSTTGVDAVLAGIPTIAEDSGSMLWGKVASPSRLMVSDPLLLSRGSWLDWIAGCQYSLHEMRSGLALPDTVWKIASREESVCQGKALE